MAEPKKIGVLLATFVVANNMIGSGFFLLPASLAGQGGVTALSWLLGTVIAVILGGNSIARVVIMWVIFLFILLLQCALYVGYREIFGAPPTAPGAKVSLDKQR